MSTASNRVAADATVCRIGSLSTGGRHLLKNGALLDYSATFAYAEEDEPGAYYTVFKQEDVEFNPNVTPSSIDPDNIQPNPLNGNVNEALFDEQSIEDNITTDRDVVAGVNLRMPLAASSTFAGSVKFGGKFRSKVKGRDASTIVFRTDLPRQ